MKTRQWLYRGSVVLLAGGLITTLLQAQSSEQASATPSPARFVYDTKNLRDPFQPNPEVLKPATGGCQQDCDTAKPTRTPEPLEKFSLESLKFAGILKYGGEIVAIIEDPAGQAYSVKTGNYMGANEGQIFEIGSGHVSLKEKAPTPTDKNATRIVSLKLHRDEEEK